MADTNAGARRRLPTWSLVTLVLSTGALLLTLALGISGVLGLLVMGFAGVGLGAGIVGRWNDANAVADGEALDAEMLERLRRFIEEAQFDPACIDDFEAPAALHDVVATLQRVFYDLHDKRVRAEGISRNLVSAQQDLEQALATARDYAARRAVYEAMFEAGAVGILICNPALEIIEANPLALAMTGLPQGQYLGRRLVSLIHPEDQRAFQRVSRELAQAKPRPDFAATCRGLRGDGSSYHMLLRGRLFGASADSEASIVLFLTDITEQKHAEQELRAMAETQAALIDEQLLFRHVFESDLIGMSIQTFRDGRTMVNGRLSEITGYPNEELEAMDWSSMVHSADRARMQRAIDRAIAGAAPEFSIEAQLVCRDRVVVDVQLEGRCQFGDDGRPSWFVLLVQEVTARKRAEVERSRALESLKYLLANIPDGVVDVDAQGRILSANPAFLKMFSYGEEDVLGEQITTLIPTYDPNATGGPRSYTGDTRGIRRDGSDIEIGYHSKRRHFEGRQIHTVIVYDNSVTKTLISEIEEARDEALSSARVKSAFLANMSHELRTPLNGVLGMLNLLSGTRTTQEQRDYIDAASHSGEHLLNIINEVLDYSKIEAHQVAIEHSEFALHELVEDLSEVLATRAFAKGVDLACVVDADLPTHFLGDSLRLRQVLTNLIGNAVKFTNRGEIVIHVSEVASDSPAGSVLAAERRIRFEVRDSGVGIKAEALANIFESFVQADSTTTRDFGGTGLGLSICRQIVELMQGEIAVESTVGQGSTFSFEVPLGEVPAPPTDDCPPEIRGLNVLLFEPNPSVVASLREALAPLGTLLTVLPTAADLDQWLGFRDQAMPQLVLVDFFPNLDAGREFVTKLRGHQPLRALPVVALTAFGRGLDRTMASDLDLAGYLPKPVRRKRLLASLKSVMGIGELEGIGSARDDAGTLENVAGARVLVVDDVEVNLTIIEGMLRRWGINVTRAADGQEAVMLFGQHHGFDLVLMDCQMPVMDGYEATRQLRDLGDLGEQVPIIAMTAAAMKEERERCIASGMNDVLTKPFDLERLVELLQTWLPKQQAQAPASEPSAREASAAARGQLEAVPAAASPADALLEQAMGRSHDADGSVVAPEPAAVELAVMDYDTVPLLDRDKLEQLANILGRDAVRQLVRTFTMDAKAKAMRLELSVRQENAAQCVSLLHSLKGASSNVGAPRLHALTKDLENAARSGGTGSVDDTERLRGLISETGDALEQELEAL